MRLVVVSNRVSLPSNVGVQAGGMTVGIEGALRQFGGVWLGWSGTLTEDGSSHRRHERSRGVDYVTLDLPRSTFEGYYSGFANQVLWPLFHHRADLISFDRDDFDAYLAVNARFAEELAGLVALDDVIWVHDYHLIPLARELRRRGLKNRIGFFLHTPFGDPGDMMRLPTRDTLADCLSAYDLVGFQTQADLRAFRGFMTARDWVCERHPMRRATPPLAAAFPIGIDYEAFVSLADGDMVDPRLRAAFEKLAPRARGIIAVDRLDYSKAIAEKFCSFDRFLTLHPEHAGRIGLIQVAPVSRAGVPAYQAEAARVKRAYTALRATHDWGGLPPAQLLTEGVDRPSIAAAYRRSAVALVTPLRDGMNLVAKEYVAAQNPADPGALVLSRYAGASEELADGALLVDPRDDTAVCDALHRALGMTKRERKARWRTMIETVRQHDAGYWARRFINALTTVEAPREPVIATRRPEPVQAWRREVPTAPAAVRSASSVASQSTVPNASG